jgi:hypothetical protein
MYCEDIYSSSGTVVLFPEYFLNFIGALICEQRRGEYFQAAAQAALDALQRIYNYPMAHFRLGMTLAGSKSA